MTSGLFGALAKCTKNLNPKEDPTLVGDVMAELKKIDGEKRQVLYQVKHAHLCERACVCNFTRCAVVLLL